MRTLNIELTPEQEACLAAIARREGLTPADIVRQLVAEHFPTLSHDEERDPMLALFAQWDQEVQNLAPAEIAEENRTWEEFKANINAERDRAGARRVY